MAIKAGEVITEYKGDLRDLERAARRAPQLVEESTRRINRSLGSVGSGRGGLLPGLAQISEVIQGIPQIGRLAGALLDPLKEATEEGVRFNMMVESAEVGFKGVAGSIENARKHVSALRQFGEDSPLFDSSGLVRTSRLMNVFGFELSEHIPKIKIWGDAIASSGEMSEETLLGVARAFGQIRSLGRVNAEEMNQLAERGIPAWELLAKAIGKSVAETRKLGEQGRLRGAPAVEAITAMIAQDPRFRGTAEGLAGTTQGRLARFGEIRERSQGMATEGLTRDISAALAGALQREDLAVTMAQGINTAITPVSGLIRGAIVTTIGGGFTGGFEEAFSAAKSVLPAGAMSLVTDGILAPMMKAAGVQSPSTKTRYIGLMLAAGLQEGLTEGLAARPFSEEIERAIAEAARATGLDPNLIRAVIRQESGGRKNATSNMGAMGLMQLMPGTARGLGVTNPYDVRQNVMGGSKYLAELLAEFKSLRLALAAYNAGPGAVRAFLPNRPDVNSYVGGSGRRWFVSEEAAQRAQGIPSNNQTPGYVRNIMGMYAGGSGGGLASMSVAQQQALVFQMAHSAGLWGGGRYGGGSDLAGGTGMFAQGGFRDVPGGSGLDDVMLPRGAWRFDNSLLQASKPVESLARSFRDAKEVQFELLKLMGDAGPVSEQAYGQAEQAVRDWYAEVVDSGSKAKTVFGISAGDAAGAFEDAWVGATTRVDEGLGQMLRNIPLNFAQSLNAMAQQWAASQISNVLGKLIGWGLGAITGGASAGGVGSAAGGVINAGGFASGGSFMVGGPTGVDKTPVFFMASRGEEVTVRTPAQQRQGSGMVINNTNYNINVTVKDTPVSYSRKKTPGQIGRGVLMSLGGRR